MKKNPIKHKISTLHGINLLYQECIKYDQWVLRYGSGRTAPKKHIPPTSSQDKKKPSSKTLPALTCYTINVLLFRTLLACQKGLDKQGRPRSDCFFRSSLIRVFPVCYPTNILRIPALKTNTLFKKRKRKSVRNFRTFTVLSYKLLKKK